MATRGKYPSALGVMSAAALLMLVGLALPSLAQPAASDAKDPPPELRAKRDELVANLAQLTTARQYGPALAKCEEALKDPAFKPFESELNGWQRAIQSCSRFMARARANARNLVGKPYGIEIKTGEKGRMRVTGEVAGFEDGVLTIRTGTKETRLEFERLAATEVARLASEGQEKSLAAELDQAIFLFCEGQENAAWGAVRDAQERGRAQPELAEAVNAAQSFFKACAEQRRRGADERRAADLIKGIRQDEAGKKWAAVLTRISQLKEQLKDTDTYKREAPALDALLEKARKEQEIALSQVKGFKFWKFLDARLPPTGVWGKDAARGGLLWAVKYSPDGKRLAVAHTFGVDLWDTERWDVARRLDGYASCPRLIDFSPGGALIATNSDDRTVTLYEAPTGKHVSRCASTSNIVSLALAPRRTALVATGHEDGSIGIWHQESGQILGALRGHLGAVKALAFMPRLQPVWLASGSTDKTVNVWDVKSATELTRLQGHPAEVRTLDFGGDGTRLATGSSEGTVRVWDATRLQTPPKGVAPVDQAEPPERVQILPMRVAPAARTFPILHVFRGQEEGLVALSFSHGGQLVALAHTNGLRVLDLGRAAEVFRLRLPNAVGVSFSPDGKMIAGASGDPGQVVLYEAGTGAELRTIPNYSDWQAAVCFSPTEPQALLSARYARSPDTFKLWDVDQGRQLSAWPGDGRNEQSPAFTRDGKHLVGVQVTSAHTAQVVVLDANSGKTLRVLGETSADAVGCLAVSLDNSRVAYRADMGVVKVCDFRTGRAVAEMRGAHPNALAISPDGRVVATSSRQNKAIRLWDAST
ncbi:MAG: hypothetical protein FJ279_26985, partial [Planctomycetes bacterium]|nr:hypothetical protein [Planctomycetota bacterium]